MDATHSWLSSGFCLSKKQEQKPLGSEELSRNWITKHVRPVLVQNNKSHSIWRGPSMTKPHAVAVLNLFGMCSPGWH